ncbi:hypothetical protein [Kitasatospora sp. NPDC056184]|uniref:hypothetical protein n=1 Tax=Kitasatospora sp. NPDC056184 TaxID=3345738 RepID=UPI0035DE8D8B
MSVPDVARRLPTVSALRDLRLARAAVEAVLAPGDPFRRHGFGARGASGCEVAGTDDGTGDSSVIVFSAVGANHLFDLLVDGTPEAFRDRAEASCERPVDVDALRRLCALRPPTAPMAGALDPGADLHRLRPALAATACPQAAGPTAGGPLR